QAGDRVRGAGARGHEDAADLAGRAGIALRHVDRTLFVPDEDVADVVLLEDLVIDRQHRAARVAEDHLDALVPERLNHHLRTGHLPRHLRLSVRAVTCTRKSPRGSFGGAWEPLWPTVTGPCAKPQALRGSGSSPTRLPCCCAADII